MRIRAALPTALAASLLAPVALGADGDAWRSDPVAAGTGCDGLDYAEVRGFVDHFEGDGPAYQGSQQESGARMLQDYAIASTLVTRSQACLAAALELRELAERLEKEVAVLRGGTSMSKRQMKRQRRLTEEANAEIEAAMEDLEELTPEQRERFRDGTAAYLAGTFATGRVFRSVDEYFAETAREAREAAPRKRSLFGGGGPSIGGALDAARDVADGLSRFGRRARDASLVFDGLKDHVVDLLETSRMLDDYSRRNAVDLPPDATEQLGAVSDWV